MILFLFILRGFPDVKTTRICLTLLVGTMTVGRYLLYLLVIQFRKRVGSFFFRLGKFAIFEFSINLKVKNLINLCHIKRLIRIPLFLLSFPKYYHVIMVDVKETYCIVCYHL